jgi:serine phosphatase RsbU (regulator of sigma subunit)/CBS domain-containing protein
LFIRELALVKLQEDARILIGNRSQIKDRLAASSNLLSFFTPILQEPMPQPPLTVRQVMQVDPLSLPPEATIQEALDRMNQLRIGAVLITGENRKLLGIFTERDFLRRATTASPGWRTISIAEWMSPQPFIIDPETGWEEAVTAMYRLRVRHLPVVENQQVIGLISSRQLLGKRNDHLNQLIEERTRELRRANDQLLARDSELTHYMKVAAKVQKRLVLPSNPPDWPEFTWGTHFAPLDPLGGDFYDFAQPDEHHLGILIADASGHSIPAALHAIMARFSFQEASNQTIHPGEVLDAMNRRLNELIEDRFVTAFYAVIDRRDRTLTYANAGHPFPLRVVRESAEAQPLSARGFPLGISADEIYREKSVSLQPGDRLCFFTDGLPDLCDEMGESFGTQRIGHFLQAHCEKPISELTTRMVDHLRTFQGTRKATDDLTILLAGLR